MSVKPRSRALHLPVTVLIAIVAAPSFALLGDRRYRSIIWIRKPKASTSAVHFARQISLGSVPRCDCRQRLARAMVRHIVRSVNESEEFKMHSWKVGDVKITRMQEQEPVWPGTMLLNE